MTPDIILTLAGGLVTATTQYFKKKFPNTNPTILWGVISVVAGSAYYGFQEFLSLEAQKNVYTAIIQIFGTAGAFYEAKKLITSNKKKNGRN